VAKSRTNNDQPNEKEYVGKQYELDSVDLRILALKVQFPKVSNAKIGAELGISRQAVSARVNKPAFKAALLEYSAGMVEILRKAQLKAARELGRLVTSARSEHVRARASEFLIYRGQKVIGELEQSNDANGQSKNNLGGTYRGVIRDDD